MSNSYTVYSYALKNVHCGKYYTGKAGLDWLGPRQDAYTYTEIAAYAKIDRMPNWRKLFVVERLP